MDDLLLFADEKDTLWNAKEQIEEYVQEKLCLEIKENAVLLAPVFQGLPFLGFQIFPEVIRISHKGWRRFQRKIHKRGIEYHEEEIDYDRWGRSVAGLIGHVQQANTRNLCKSFFYRLGAKGALTE